MNEQQNNHVADQLPEPVESRGDAQSTPQPKKQFVEPVVSVPVDVLESTTFFQATTVETTTV